MKSLEKDKSSSVTGSGLVIVQVIDEKTDQSNKNEIHKVSINDEEVNFETNEKQKEAIVAQMISTLQPDEKIEMISDKDEMEV